MLQKYRALHTHNTIMSYGKNEYIPAKSNKVPTVTIIDGVSAEWVVKGLIFNTTTKFIYNPNINLDINSDSKLYSQVDNPNVVLQVFGKHMANGAVITKDLDTFGNESTQYWYEFSQIN